MVCRTKKVTGFVREAGGLLAVASVALACSDSQGPGTHIPQPLPPSPFVVSSPVPRPASAISSPSSSTSAAAGASTVVYVSLPPGAIPGGRTAIIQDQRLGSSVTAALVDGGFDPVPLPAAVGDTLEVAVQAGGAEPVSYQVIVVQDVSLIVVRTSPPRNKRDVPLNARMVVVFSQPIDPATLAAGIQLWRGATPVGGRVQFADVEGIRAEFQPDNLLAENTDYQLLVTQAIHDVNGQTVDSTTVVPFTTAAAVSPLLAVGGSVSGLAGSGLVLLNNGGDPTMVSADGPFTFATTLPRGAVYKVTVLTQPSDPVQVCSVFSGTGALFSDVTNVSVRCISGLALGRIAFAGSGNDGIQHIYTVDLEGLTLTQLTNDAAPDFTPAWSPDHQRIAFQRTGDPSTAGIWIMQADGSGAVRVSSLGGAPSWSPDGSRIVTMAGNSMWLISTNGVGGDIKLKDSLPGLARYGKPAWSPNGSTIAFNGTVDLGGDFWTQVYLMNGNGSNVHRLTSSNGVQSAEGGPAWSPDGSRVAFWSFVSGITVANRDGSSAHSVAGAGPFPSEPTVWFDAEPDWSPDGSRLVFRKDGQLVVARADGSDAPLTVTSMPGGAFSPAWTK